MPLKGTVADIQVDWEDANTTSGTIKDNAARIVKGGTIGTTDRSSATSRPSSDTFIAHGGSTDLWGDTWSVPDVNASTFGAALSAQQTSSGSHTGSVDSVRIIVSYVTCGNGVVDAGEQCDDGVANGTATSCCAANCTFKSAGTACNDACTAGTCQSGVCIGNNPVVCTASDQCHDAGTCDTATGQCSNPNASNGTACSDGNACTQTDTCQSGTCTGANPVVCTASDQCHVAGTCNTATGLCSNPNASNGTACSDGNACTQTDTCQGGSCTGSNPVVCTALDPCHVAGTCNTATGLCSNPNAGNGTACNDNNACTQTDTCQTGRCTGSKPVVC